MGKCKINCKRAMDGLCCYKFCVDDRVFCVCKDRKDIKCEEESAQLKLVRLRWASKRKS